MKKILIILPLIFISCMVSPTRKDFSSEELFAVADCLFRNKDNPDKSICSELIKNYCLQSKEKRIMFRLEYCKKNTFTGMSENECRLYLNKD